MGDTGENETLASLGLSNVHVSHHPLLHSKLSLLRSSSASSIVTRQLVKDVTLMLAYEATSHTFVPQVIGQGESPMGVIYPVQSVSPSRVAVVPILRSGLGMTDEFLRILPADTVVHHLGIFREKSTLSPVEYYNKLPPASKLNSHIDIAFVVDPIIATGGTASITVQILKEWGVGQIVFVCILASSGGIQRAANEWPEGTLFYVGEIDEELSDTGYILPGIGDIGVRHV